jgi:hypothetical protein
MGKFKQHRLRKAKGQELLLTWLDFSPPPVSWVAFLFYRRKSKAQ